MSAVSRSVNPSSLLSSDDQILHHLHSESQEDPTISSPEASSYRFHVMLRAVVGELIASFMFLFVAMASNVNLSTSVGNIPIENGLVCGLMAVGVIYSFADISGAHFNPAVTFATWIAGKLSNRKAILFIIAQMLGSLIASGMIISVYPAGSINSVVVRSSPGVSVGKVFLMEMYLSFILVFVIFTTAFELIPSKPHYSKVKSNDLGLTLYSVSPQSKAGFAPIAIGFCIFCLSLTGGSVSGGAFNPARAFGPAVCANDYKNLWVYWVADLVGAALAVLVRQSYWFVFGDIKVEKAIKEEDEDSLVHASV